MTKIEDPKSRFEKFYAGMTKLIEHIPGGQLGVSGNRITLGPLNDFMPTQLVQHLAKWGWKVSDQERLFYFDVSNE